jgi:hypothetical protein
MPMPESFGNSPAFGRNHTHTSGAILRLFSKLQKTQQAAKPAKKEYLNMKVNTRHWLLVVVVLALFVLTTGSPVFAIWQVNQHYHNNMADSATAYDLTKIIRGNVHIMNVALGTPFTVFDSLTFGFPPRTIFHWSGGVVPHCSWFHGCFQTDTRPRSVAAFWTDSLGHKIGRAGPVHIFEITYNPVTQEAAFTLINDWQEWNGAGFPPQPGDDFGDYVGVVQVLDAKYALDDANRVLADLDSTLLVTPGIVWHPLAELIGPINPGDSLMQVVNVGELPPGRNIDVYFAMQGPSGEGAYDVVVLQRPTGVIPTLSEWGIIIFGVVLIGFITWVFLKRRQVIGVRY